MSSFKTSASLKTVTKLWVYKEFTGITSSTNSPNGDFFMKSLA